MSISGDSKNNIKAIQALIKALEAGGYDVLSSGDRRLKSKWLAEELYPTFSESEKAQAQPITRIARWRCRVCGGAVKLSSGVEDEACPSCGIEWVNGAYVEDIED